MAERSQTLLNPEPGEHYRPEYMKFSEWVDTVLIEPRKLTDYCLCFDNPKGRDKAFMFQQYLGYNRENYQILVDQIKSQVLEAEARRNNDESRTI